jgi:nitroreductase
MFSGADLRTERSSLDLFELLRKRHSVRNYQTRPVENKKILAILDAARLGPSAANLQPCHFVVVRNKKLRKSMKAAYHEEWFLQAPVIIVGCVDPGKSWCRRDGEEYWKVDTAIAMQNLILASTELGLGTCWIANFDEDPVKKLLNVPDSIRIVAMTPVGYADEKQRSAVDRKPLKDMVHWDKW